MNIYKKFITYIFAFAFCFIVQSVFSELYAAENLDELIEEALNNNPNIQVGYNMWKADEYKVTQARSLPDPMVHYGYFGESIETRVGPQEHKIGGSLKVPFPAKLVVKGRSQKKSAKMSKEEYEATKREIIRGVKVIYYDIYWVDKAIQITKEEKSILESLEKVAKRKYESNTAPQQDVIKAQVEITKLINKLFTLQENRKSLVSRMNSILNRPRNSTFKLTGNVTPQKMLHDLEQLQLMASESRQELKKAHIAIKKAEHEKSLAKLGYVPDFTFGFDYTVIGSGSTTMPNDGKNAWIGTASINLPIWFHTLNSQVKEKKAMLAARKKSYENIKNVVSYEVEDIYYKISSYKDIIELHRTALIPQTEQVFDAARVGYESGKVDFLNWLDAERTLLQTRLSYYRAIVDYQKAVANLERVIGQNI